jgi:hypothetical protein
MTACDTTHNESKPRPAHAHVSWGTQGCEANLCRECVDELWRRIEPLAKAGDPGGRIVFASLPAEDRGFLTTLKEERTGRALYKDVPVTAADSLLIAAAPDLLAAAKSMFDAARNNPLLMMALSSPLGLPAARALKAAIDKAEGTQSTGEKE